MVTNKTSLLELIEIFAKYHNSIIINIKHLQENYQRIGIKRVKGVRDEKGKLIPPWLQTKYIDNAEYVGMGEFEFNHNTATINMLVKRKAKLAKVEDKTSITEVAGLLANDLNTYNNYTIVSEGTINVESLQVKISSKKVFDLLKQKGVLDAENFDFHVEYTIQLNNLPLVPFDRHYSSIDGLFYELAKIKVLASIISAHLKEESDIFVPAQLNELKKHYLSKQLYINFPTTNAYTNITEALAVDTLDSRFSYKIDIGSQDILNLSKLYSANRFLNRMYQVYDKETGEIFTKPSFKIAFNKNLAFRDKQLSQRTKITKVDDLMKPIFDDFIGIEDNGIVADILTKVDADNLVQLLQEKRTGKHISKEEIVAALTTANTKLEQYTEKIYRDKISPWVFYIGSTGMLPNKIATKAMTSEEVAAKYPNLRFSKYEQEGIFFVVGDSIISVYTKIEYYSKKAAVCEEN